MSSAGPWSVKGIDPKAREVAKDLARRSGMTLGEWLNQMIIEGGEPEPPPPESGRRPVLQAGLQQPRPEPSYYEPEPPPRLAAAHAPDELARLTRALDAFSARLEAAEHRSTLAISGIDQSVMGVLSRLDGVERDQAAVAGRFEGALDEVRSTQAKLADRVRRMEQDDGPRVEAMKALEAALGRVAAQIYEGESRARGAMNEVRQDLSGIARRVDRLEETPAADNTQAVEAVVAKMTERLEAAEQRTAAAVRALETSFASLDDRLKTAEVRLEPQPGVETPERRFERLGAELAERVEASRAELVEHIRAAADARLDRMEEALRDLSGHVESAERQSAQAIDRMGREVMRIAQSLGQRVTAVETRSAEAVEQVGGEMARIADAMESRMRTSDQTQAEALERLGGEIGRIAERLAERIAASERRAAAAIDEVGDQVARVTDKINTRYDRSASELSERIRQSEERTARLLEEARETLDRRLIETQRKSAIEAAVQHVEAPPPAVDDFDDDAFAVADAYAPSAGYVSDVAAPFPDDPFAPSPPIPEAEPALASEPPGFEQEEAAAPVALAAAPAAPAEVPAPPLDEPYEDFTPGAAPRSSTRELIEAARAAARQAAAADSRGRRARQAASDLFTPSTPAPAAEPLSPPRGLGGILGKKKKKKDGGTVIRTALLASVTAAFLTSSFVGYSLLAANKSKAEDKTPPPRAAGPVTVANPAAQAESSDAELLAAALTQPSTEAAAPDAAAPAKAPAKPAETAPVRATRAAAAAPSALAGGTASAALANDPKQLYSAAVRKIESGDNTGLEALRRAAGLGYAQAQFYLAKLYETGGYGLKRDPAEARRWTERAAQSGDPKAMHNLGLYYFEGTGGPKNTTEAAAWFRKAAEAGLQDSQYNLARLYEQGYGVAQNPAEAYKWYLIAAAGGDNEARTSAERLRAQLSPDSAQAAQRSASAFRPQQTALAAK